MKTIRIMLFLAFSLLTGSSLFAQQQAKNSDVINTEISKAFNLKDDVILQNNTLVQLSEVVMTVTDDSGKIIAMSRAKNMSPANERRIYTTSHNMLKQLRGKHLTLKIQGEGGETSDSFRISLEENRHDLIIKLFSASDYEN